MIPDQSDITLVNIKNNIDLAIADGDFSIFGSQPQETSETEYVKTLRDDVLLRIVNSPGEWFSAPHMGSGLRSLVGLPNTPSVLSLIVQNVHQALTRDFRIPPNDLDVQIVQHNLYEISLKIIIIVDGDEVDMSPDMVFNFDAGLRTIHRGDK